MKMGKHHSDRENNHKHSSRFHSSEHRICTRTPVQERSIQTRSKIIDAGMKLFSEKGYHSTNSKEIASLAGVATGCFYSYFVDKREVFIEALRIYLSKFDEMLNTYLAGVDYHGDDRKKLLYGLVKCLIKAHDFFPGIHNELNYMRLEDPEIDKILFEKDKSSIQNTYKQIMRWKDILKVTNHEVAAVLIFNTLQSIVDIIVLKQTDADEETLISETVDMIDNYLFK